MKKIDDLRNYILEKDPKIIILKNKINIINYKKILDITNEKIELLIEEKTIKIFGKNLVVNKMLSDEILISGVINKLEIG